MPQLLHGQAHPTETWPGFPSHESTSGARTAVLRCERRAIPLSCTVPEMLPAAPCPRSSAPRFTAVSGRAQVLISPEPAGEDEPWGGRSPSPRRRLLSRCAPPARGIHPPPAFTGSPRLPPRTVGKGDSPLPKTWERCRLTAFLSAELGGAERQEQQERQERRAPGHGSARTARAGHTDGTDGRDTRAGHTDGTHGRDGRTEPTGRTGAEAFTPSGGVRLEPRCFTLPRNSGSAGTG